MEWNKVMNFGDPSTFGTEMADRFVGSGANLPSPVSNRGNGSYIMSFLKVMTLILVHLEEFQNKHALIRISLADKVKLIEDSKKPGFDKFTASDENDVAEVFCSDL